MTKPNSTEIIFVVDRSGSMQNIAADMKGGFDTFISKQKETPGDCRVTLTQFDDRYDVVYNARPLNEVAALELEPRGMTALLDAIGRTISETGNRLKNLKESARPSQVLFVIITDGAENASKEFSRDRVFNMITHQRDKYDWEFVFLGANQDAIATATQLGISATNSVTYDANAGGSQAIFKGLSANVSNYRGMGRSKMDNLFNQAKYSASLDPNAKDEDLITQVVSDVKLTVDVKTSK
jgi:hypothetical protein